MPPELYVGLFFFNFSQRSGQDRRGNKPVCATLKYQMLLARNKGSEGEYPYVSVAADLD